MGIYLGNLSAKQIADRLSIKMTDEDITEMERFRCHEADVKMGRWHCFDIPFMVLCGDIETCQTVCEILRPYSGVMKGQLCISWQKGEE